MSTLESFRRQARQLVRWHREGNYSIGGRIRKLPRYREITDTAALALRFPLAEAQEIIACENGYQTWAALKNALGGDAENAPGANRDNALSANPDNALGADPENAPASGEDEVKIIKVVQSQESRGSRPPVREPGPRPSPKPVLKGAIPILFVSNVTATAGFFRDKLGFDVDFLHGEPPFYGSVSRDGARLHLRFVHEPAFAPGIVEREQLLAAYLDVKDAKALFAEYVEAGVPMHGRLKKEPWGGPGFTILDPDGNRIYFGE